MAAFQDGHKKIEGSGRKEGVKNKNNEIRELIRDFSVTNFPVFVQKMLELDPKDYCMVYKDLLKYVVPTISSIKFDDVTDVKNAASLFRSLMNYDDEK